MIDAPRPRRSARWPLRIASTIAATAMLIGGGALAAHAAGTYRTLGVANVRSAPTTSSLIIGVLTRGASVTIDCYASGQSVSGTTVWDHLLSGGYVSDSLILTYSNNPVVPVCGAFNRSAAASWAIAHVNDAPRYAGDDCAWFVSQALWAGGLPKSNAWSDVQYGLPHPTADAVNANQLKDYLASQSGLATIIQVSPTQRIIPQAQPGDVIGYDWNHDGFVDHVVLVTSVVGQYPTVTGHTNKGTQPWDLSTAWVPLTQVSPGLRVYLIHITK